MKKILGLRMLLDLTMAIILIGGLVFTLGFGACLYIAREEVTHEVGQKIARDMAYVQSYVDGQLQRVEDVAYTLASSKFGKTVRKDDGEAYVTIDPTTFTLPSEEEIFQLMEHMLDANPQICGAAIGFENGIFPHAEGQYGFAAYVTNVGGKRQRLKLGEIHDFHQKEWYKNAASTNKPYWSSPFRETSCGKVVACFSLPLHGYGNRFIGTLALDIDTEHFRQKCAEITPFPGAEVTLVDSEFRFICHTDSSFLLKNVTEVGNYSTYKADDSMQIKMLNHQSGHYTVNENTGNEALFYFEPIERTNWMLSVECPKSEVYKGVKRMKRDTTWIAAGSILLMIVCFVLLFRRMQGITSSKAVMERDLTIASAIQMGMIPKTYPAFPDRDDLDVCGFLKPAKQVGGDLYDYFIKDDKFYFCLGDVSGKGVPASLFMAVVRSLFRNVSLHCQDPAEILSSLNTALSEGNSHNMFCTIFLGILDIKTGHLDYCNGGHNAPVIRRLNEDGSINVHYTKPKVNLAIGVFPDFPYQMEETTLKPGEALFLYTDGVTEAENVNAQLFGEERLLEALSKARHDGSRTAQDFVQSIYQSVEKFAAGAEQSDDITMLVVEYKGA